MDKYYKVVIFVQGELFRTSKSKNGYNYRFVDKVKEEIHEKYPGYKCIYDNGDQCYVLFNKEERKSLCYHVKYIEYTGLMDCIGTPVKVGDVVVSKYDRLHTTKMKVGVYHDEYYLRDVNLTFTSHMQKHAPDVYHLDQSKMEEYEVI